MDRQTIVNLLENFLKEHGSELPDDLRKKIEGLIEKLKTEPDETLAAEVLAKIIEELADKLPPGISAFVKAYAEALKTGIKAGELRRCNRYNSLREMKFDDEDAAQIAGLDPRDHAICRLRWDLSHVVPNPPGDPGNPPPGPVEWLGPAPSGPAWDEADNPCCSKTANTKPTVRLQNPVLSGDHTGSFFSGEVVISHECGILYDNVTVTIGQATIGDRTHETFPHASVDEEKTDGGKKVTVTFNKLQVGLKIIPKITVNVVAISRCMGRTETSFPVP